MLSIELFFVLLQITVICTLFRAVPALLWPPYGGDAAYHFYYIDEIRKNKSVAPLKTSKFVLEREVTYPWGFHVLCSYIKPRTLKNYPFLPSLFFDILHSYLVVILIWYLLPANELVSVKALTSLMGGVFFCVNPALLGVGGGPRAYELTPRVAVEFFSVFAFFTLGIFEHSGNLLALLLSITSVSAAVLYGRFALQVFLFFSLFFAIISKDALPLLVFLCGLILAILWTRGRFIRILWSHVLFLSNYRQRVQHEHPAMEYRKKVWPFSGLKTKKEILKVLLHQPLFIFATRNMLTLLVLFAVFVNFGDLVWYHEIPKYLGVLTFVSIFSFLCVLIPPLRFLGEAERYPEFAVSSVSILATLIMYWQNLPYILCCILFLLLSSPILLFSWIQMFRTHKANRVKSAKISELLNYLGIRDRVDRVLLLPDRLSSVVALETKHLVLSSMDFFLWNERWEKLFSRYPWPNTDLKYWKDMECATLVVFDSVNGRQTNAPLYDFTGLKKIFDNDYFEVYEF